MTFPFSAIVTASGAITFTGRDGASNTITRENARYDEAKELLRQIGGSVCDLPAGEDEQTELINELVKIASPAKAIASDTGGRVFVREGKVFFRDVNETSEVEVHNVVAERIVWMISEGFDAKPMLGFLDHLMDNPSYRSVNDLYRFMERNQMGITPDGQLLAYKKVRNNFSDIYTGTFDNTPGQRPKMRRNDVEDNPNVTCSHGLHVCSYSYLPQFGSSGGSDRVVVCKVNPRDVVSVPTDYNDAKMRVCEYLVLKEIDYKDSGDVLGRKAVIDETVPFDENDEGERCPDCSAHIDDANYCKSCGWEREEDELCAVCGADIGDANYCANCNEDDDEDEDGETEDAPDSSNLEQPPVIEFLQHGGRWTELIGHCCSTAAEAQNYVDALDPSGSTMRVRKADTPVAEAVAAATWPERTEDKALDLRNAVSGVTQAAEGLFGTADVAVHMRLDGDGGLEVKMRPEGDLSRKVKMMLTEHLGVEAEKVTLDALIGRDLGADSLDGVELTMAFEEEFGIDIPDDEMTELHHATVSDVIDFLDKKVERPI